MITAYTQAGADDAFPSRTSRAKHDVARGLYFPEAEGAGATYSSSIDDYPAVNAALTAALAAGGTLVLSRFYKLNSTLAPSGHRVQINGAAGRASCGFKTSGITAIKNGTPTTRYYRWSLLDFTIDGLDKTTAGGLGLDFTNVSLSDFRIELNNLATGFVTSEQSYYNHAGFWLSAIGVLGRVGASTSSMTTNENYFTIRANSFTEGIYIANGDHHVFYNPSMESFTGTAFHIGHDPISNVDSVVSNIDIISPRFDSTGGTCYHNYAGSTKNRAVGGYFSGVTTELVNDGVLEDFTIDRPSVAAGLKRLQQLMFYGPGGATEVLVKATDSSQLLVRNPADSAYAPVLASGFFAQVGGEVRTPLLTVTLAAQTLAANGAVAIDATAGDAVITLQANATSSTIANPAVSGQRLSITWVQDATGGRTYAWPANCKFAGGSAPSDTTPNARTTVEFRYAGSSTWIELSRAVAVA